MVCCMKSFSSHVFFFFFKQKTAYEMRISDWSSDVCSSDLIGQIGFALHQLAAEIARHKGARIVHEPLARQIFEDVENLLGIFLVRDELAEVLERLERAELLRLAVGVGENRGGHGRSRSNHLIWPR